MVKIPKNHTWIPQTRSPASTLPETKWLPGWSQWFHSVGSPGKYSHTVLPCTVFISAMVQHFHVLAATMLCTTPMSLGSIFSMPFSYTAGLTGALNHPHVLFSSWKEHCCLAPVLQPSPTPMASMGLVPTSSHLQEPRAGHSVSAAVSEVPNRETALLASAQPWSSNGAQHVGGHLHLHSSLRAQISLHKAASPPLCAQDLQPHPLSTVPTVGLHCMRFLSSLQLMSTALLISGNRK